MLFFPFRKFPIGLKQNSWEEDNLSTRDKRSVPNVSFVWRFYSNEKFKHWHDREHVDGTSHNARNKVKIGFNANLQLRFVSTAIGIGKLFQMIHHYSNLLVPKFQPVILSNQPIILHSQRVIKKVKTFKHNQNSTIMY